MELKYKRREFSLEDILNEETFTVPSFQRGLSWKKLKKQNFIKTLIKGEPFGTILIYEDKKDTYIIDGLQRITTIREFYNNKYELLTSEIIDIPSIKEFISEIKKIYKNNNLKIEGNKEKLDIERIHNKLFAKIQKYNGDIELVIEEFKKYFNLREIEDKAFNDVRRTLKRIISDINRATNINGLKVYAIEYTGDKNRLPDIFYSLNTGGTIPSKYEVLASLWNNITFKIDDQEIIDAVYSRYDIIKKESQLKIVVTKDDLKKNGITLFEYCYAIGKIIYSDKYGFTSFLGESINNIESTSFSIIALLVGLKENEASKIAKKLSNANPRFLKDLKKVIIDGFEAINEGLENWIKTERITKTHPVSYNRIDSNYMIYHMFMSYVKKNYTIDPKTFTIRENRGNSLNSWNKKFIENIHINYFYDFITDYWSRNRQVQDLMENIKNEEKLYKYSYKISKEKWESAFKDFKEKELEYYGGTFDRKTKLFLDFLIKFKTMRGEKPKSFTRRKDKEKELTIDMEHIVPLGRFEERGLTDTLPKYSLGNVCYLSSAVNVGKGEETLYEWSKKRPEYRVDNDVIKFVSYPNEEELDEFINLPSAEFKEGYKNFISNRIDKLIDEFKDNMI